MPKSPFDDISVENEEFQLLMEKTGVKPLVADNQTQQVESLSKDLQTIDLPESSMPKQKYAGISQLSQVKIGRKKEKKRNIEPEIVLDLHGETCESALNKVIALIQDAKRAKVQSIIIVTGKGLHSEHGQGILRRFVWDWLSQNQHLQIRNFRRAPEKLGGSGAIIVELF